MPVSRSTKECLIIANSSCHADVIGQMTRSKLLEAADSKDPKVYNTIYRATDHRQCSVDTSPYLQISEPSVHALKEQVVSPTKRVFKNLIVLGCAFMFLFTAFVSLQSLQSTLNAHKGVGVVSLSCVYSVTVISCLIAPAVIKKLTTKWTIVLAYTLFLLYIGANFYPMNYLMIPASVLLGFLTGPLWSAQSTYLTTLAINYARTSDQLHDTTINRFNGIFCGILQTSQVWGNLLSAAIFHSDNQTVLLNPKVNASRIKNVCGATDCGSWGDFPDDNLPHSVAHVPTPTRYTLLSIHLGCAVMAIAITTALLDRTDDNTEASKSTVALTTQQLLLATLKVLQDPRLQLLLPLIVFTGLEQGFILGDFTKSYVNCALGIHKIGYVLMCFGAVNSATSVCIGQIARHIKRLPIMAAGAAFNAGLLMVLLWWKPSPDDVPMFYVISACLGLCDGIWQTQSNTLFGVLFADHQEAAFACYRMFQAIGFAVAFGYSYVLCVYTKLYIIGGVMTVGLLLYTVVELRINTVKRYRDRIVVL